MDLYKNNQEIDIVKVRNGDRNAFKILIEIYYDDLYLFAQNLCRDQDLSKDLVQEVFFSLWENRKNINTKSVIKGWLYQSLKNKFIDHIRKHKKETVLLETNLAELTEQFVFDENQQELNQKVSLLEKEIALLPKKCHEVFIMSKKEGLSNQEIADYLNISLKTVEGHLTKALKILREKLHEQFKILFTFFYHQK